MSENKDIDSSFFNLSELPGEDADRRDPLLGTLLDDRFRLERLLGEGGMGRVYAGTQLSVDREVAIKLLRGEALANREVKERFLREAKVISGFSHPNIVRLIDYGEDQERHVPYLVMELVRGVSLGELTREGRLKLRFALEIAHQVCGALMQAHAEGIIHRDLKPDNLQLVPVIGGSFQTKVLDFGIAFPSNTTSRLTSTGMICGTSYYIAPEQARAQQMDQRTDLYALGVILFEMLSGQLPFSGESDFQILLKQVQEPPPPLADLLPPEEVPREVIKLVHDLLEKSPDKRPPTARAVRERIDVIRRRCAIGPVEIDVEEVSAEAFEPLILPPSEDAALFLADTAAGAATPAEAIDQLASAELDAADTAPSPREPESERQTGESDGTTQTSQQGSARPDVDATAPGNYVDSAAQEDSDSLPLIIGGLVAAILIAGGALFVVWFVGDDDGAQTPPPGARSPRAAAPPAPTRPQNQPSARPQVPTVPVAEFAGRCRVVGQSDHWFHTLFVYPEVGEVVFQANDKLHWSPLDLDEHKRDTLELLFTPQGDSEQRSMAIRASSNKRFVDLPDAERFVCRHESFEQYWEPIELTGKFRPIEAGEDEDAEQLHLRDSRQRLLLRGHEYVYRRLEGSTASSGAVLAARRADQPDTDWQMWKLTYDEAENELRLERPKGAELFEDVQKELDAEARRKSAERRKPKTKPKSKPKPTASGKGSQTGDAAAASRGAAAQPAGARPTPPPQQSKASGETIRRFKQEFVDLADRCKSLKKDYYDKIRRISELADAGRIEEMKKLSATMDVEKELFTQRNKELTADLMSLHSDARAAGIGGQQLVDFTRLYNARCHVPPP